MLTSTNATTTTLRRISVLLALWLGGCTWIPAGVCGNGRIDADEACDDGAANADDGACTTACAVAICGDELLWNGVEECDGGPDGDLATGCSPSCTLGHCGDGDVLAGVEGCDDGPANADDGACTTACEAATCGDGLLWLGVEGCDDGAANADDAPCTPACAPAFCGDGYVLAEVEGCDDGPNNADDGACTTACEVATCGDGLIWIGVEDCDDRNGFGGDGCSPDCRFPIRMNLVDADAEMVGFLPTNRAGWTVAAAGDVDGDGFDDMLLGAWMDGAVSGRVNAAYLMRGPKLGRHDLSQADAILQVDDSQFPGGLSVAGVGDVDGDGFDDLLIGHDSSSIGGLLSGTAHLILGPVSGSIRIETADALLVGESILASVGRHVAAAGDVDDDGQGDLLVSGIGVTYLLRDLPLGLNNLGIADAKIVAEGGVPFQYSTVAAGAGDVDGDGLDDLLIGEQFAIFGEVQTGAAHLVVSPVSGQRDLADADAKLYGEAAGDRAGYSVAGAGDVDGDGDDDLLVGATDHASGGYAAGAAYLVTRSVSGTVGLATADAILVGEGSGAMTGKSVDGAGDVNGDGFDDMIVGASHLDVDDDSEGAAYVLLGPLRGTIDPTAVALRLAGEAYADAAGWSVAGAGDVDGDGHSDVLVGAGYHDEGGADAGSAYLILGGF